MIDFLFEGGIGLYLVLLLLFLFCLLLWKRLEDRRLLQAAAAFAALALVLFLFDRLRETPRERAIRTIQEVAGHLNRSEFDRAFSYFAEDFRAYDMDKKTMRAAGESAIRGYQVKNITLKRFQLKEQDREKRTLTLRFNATADASFSSEWALLECEVDIAYDDEDRFRIKSFRIYNPVVNSTDPIDVFRR